MVEYQSTSELEETLNVGSLPPLQLILLSRLLFNFFPGTRRREVREEASKYVNTTQMKVKGRNRDLDLKEKRGNGVWKVTRFFDPPSQMEVMTTI